MYAYELLPRLKYLTLVGQDEDGELEFWGNWGQWQIVQKMEMNLYEN